MKAGRKKATDPKKPITVYVNVSVIKEHGKGDYEKGKAKCRLRALAAIEEI